MSVNLLTLIFRLATGAGQLIDRFASWHRCRVRMSQPSQITLRKDHEGRDEISFDSRLYRVGWGASNIDSLNLNVRCDDSSQLFSNWAYRDAQNSLLRSGFDLRESALRATHYFLPPYGGTPFQFQEGDYHFDILANVPDQPLPILLTILNVVLTPKHVAALNLESAEIVFSWYQSSRLYRGHIVPRASASSAELLRELPALPPPKPEKDDKRGMAS